MRRLYESAIFSEQHTLCWQQVHLPKSRRERKREREISFWSMKNIRFQPLPCNRTVRNVVCIFITWFRSHFFFQWMNSVNSSHQYMCKITMEKYHSSGRKLRVLLFSLISVRYDFSHISMKIYTEKKCNGFLFGRFFLKAGWKCDFFLQNLCHVKSTIYKKSDNSIRW